jgi:molybdopterin-containing oxidoreductase family iron-sulfur binding subunit
MSRHFQLEQTCLSLALPDKRFTNQPNQKQALVHIYNIVTGFFCCCAFGRKFRLTKSCTTIKINWFKRLMFWFLVFRIKSTQLLLV